MESIDDGINDILHHDPEMNTDQYLKEQREWEAALNEERTNIHDPVTYMVETGFWETLNPHQKALISASEEIRVEDYDLAADILETAFKDGLPNNATDEMKYIFDGIKEDLIPYWNPPTSKPNLLEFELTPSIRDVILSKGVKK